MTFPPLRSQDEIQRAHDLLGPLVNGEEPVDIEPEAAIAMHAALDVLCWVLHHDHNEAFAANLKAVEDKLREHGIALRRVQ